jgi:hypothetical protein
MTRHTEPSTETRDRTAPLRHQIPPRRREGVSPGRDPHQSHSAVNRGQNTETEPHTPGEGWDASTLSAQPSAGTGERLRSEEHQQTPADDQHRWTSEAVHALGVYTDLVTAGALLGMGRTKAHELARTGQFPVPVLRHGRRYIVPVTPIARLLHLTDPDHSGHDPDTA